MTPKYWSRLQDSLFPLILWAALIGIPVAPANSEPTPAIVNSAVPSGRFLFAQAQNSPPATNSSSGGSSSTPLLLGIGAIGVGGLLWWLLKGRSSSTEEAPSESSTVTSGVTAPSPITPSAEPSTATPTVSATTSVEPAAESPADQAPTVVSSSPIESSIEAVTDMPASTSPEPPASAPTLASIDELPLATSSSSLAEGVSVEPPILAALDVAAEGTTEASEPVPFIPMTPPATPTSLDQAQSDVEATKFDVGQTDLSSESLAAVDEGLPDLPGGYGISRIVLMPRDPHWAYAYWDISNEQKQTVRQQGGVRLALRLYDVTHIDLSQQNPHSLQQYDCDELASNWYLPIPVSDRDYVVEIGYVAGDGSWLLLARSASIRIPPVYPSDWFKDQFLTIAWDEELKGRSFLDLGAPSSQSDSPTPLHGQMFDLAQSKEVQRIAGSIFGSMQHVAGSIQQVPIESVSSYVFPSGVGLWSAPTVSGLTASGMGMSGIGFAASMPPIRPRKFWLVADAELIVYGATEPNASVTVRGLPIQLSPDGTFRFHMAFPDGLIDYPIFAAAADGEQTRSIHMRFHRETPQRNTNTKAEAADEWLL